jgi:23S rRNA U2552 (ribose-2'-O)-methylase RlmE/FtsJ
MGSGEADFIKALRAVFEKVSYFKPSSSRKESKEVYLMCFKKLQ